MGTAMVSLRDRENRKPFTFRITSSDVGTRRSQSFSIDLADQTSTKRAHVTIQNIQSRLASWSALYSQSKYIIQTL